MGKSIWMVLGATVSLVLFTGLMLAEAPRAQPPEDPSAIVMSRCTKCHNTKKICNNLDKKDVEEWTQTIEKMVSRGAAVAPEDIPAMAEYLAGLESGSQPVCK
ncbi:MAG: hypothetical protein WBL38_13780 [Desulfomonilia bacterium]|nr:hypothetical protein [Deltaproteobacteria bacterium]